MAESIVAGGAYGIRDERGAIVGSCAASVAPQRVMPGQTSGIVTAIIDHNDAESVLTRSGSSWTASQSHGLLCGRICMLGAAGIDDWLRQLLEEVDPANALAAESAGVLNELAESTYRQLSERQSEFTPMLPDLSEPASVVAVALSEWCEGFLHGLVADVKLQPLKDKLAAEPISGIIKDVLEISRAEAADDEDDAEDNEAALTEIVEYLRVTTQLVYEELSALRYAGNQVDRSQGSDAIH